MVCATVSMSYPVKVSLHQLHYYYCERFGIEISIIVNGLALKPAIGSKIIVAFA